MPHEFKFPSAARLGRKKDFETVFREGTYVRAGPLIVRALPRPDLPGSRLGLAVNRKAGTACVRNRIKRLIREAFRLTRGTLSTPHDMVVSTSKAADLTFGAVGSAMRDVIQQLNARAARVEDRGCP